MQLGHDLKELNGLCIKGKCCFKKCSIPQKKKRRSSAMTEAHFGTHEISLRFLLCYNHEEK